MKWKNSLLCTAAMVVLAGVTCYILLKDHSMGTLWAVLKNADLRFVLLGLFLMVLFVGCEAAVIRLLAGTWGGSVPWKRAMQYSFAGFYFSSITPSSTGGQPMQLYYMVRDGMSAARSSFALLTITAMYQLMALAYGVGMGLDSGKRDFRGIYPADSVLQAACGAAGIQSSPPVEPFSFL